MATGSTTETSKLELGCGNYCHPGFTGVDIMGKPDIVADLEKDWPFPDNSVEEAHAHSVLEHLADLPHTMRELYRVMVPNGLVHVTVPYYRFVNAYSPYHKVFFTEFTFAMFDKFEIVSQHYLIFEHKIRVPNNPRLFWIVDCLLGHIISDLVVELRKR